jgi:hypothetical protein
VSTRRLVREERLKRMERAFDERDARSSVRSNQRRSDPPPERGGVHEEFVDFPRPCCIVNGPSHRTAGDEADHHAIYLRDQHRLLSGGSRRAFCQT